MRTPACQSYPDAESSAVHPALEALFNIVVAWGSLFVGFLSDGRRQRVPMLPFMVGTAFLTNVFYLPYLGLRGMLANTLFCAHASSYTRSKEREKGGCAPAAGLRPGNRLQAH